MKTVFINYEIECSNISDNIYGNLARLKRIFQNYITQYILLLKKQSISRRKITNLIFANAWNDLILLILPGRDLVFIFRFVMTERIMENNLETAVSVANIVDVRWNDYLLGNCLKVKWKSRMFELQKFSHWAPNSFRL